MRTNLLLMAVACLCLLQRTPPLYAQQRVDSLWTKIDPQKLASSLDKRAAKLSKKIKKKNEQVLASLQKQEEAIYKRMLPGKDSLEAKAKLLAMREHYASFKCNLDKSASAKATSYIPRLDSLSNALKFFGARDNNNNISSAIHRANQLQDQFNRADAIRTFARERKEQLKQQLEKLDMVKQLKQLNKEIYYYAGQIKSYKEIISDPAKIERKALELLRKTKLFNDFMQRNSLLASLFGLPPEQNGPGVALAGLQTREQINTVIRQQISAGGPNAQQQFRENIQAAQAQLGQLRDRVARANAEGSNDELPDFKPNRQKMKSFAQRLEYGMNIQSQRGNTYFPTTSDIGMSMGYKLNDKSVIGIGASYKLGLGRGWNDIAVTHQGLALRSYVDMKLNGSFWISGGYEQNYRTAFHDFDILRSRSGWQQSGLLGISKQVSLKTKLFKRTSMKLLWDFLSYQQVPRTQPVVFRVGYSIR